MARDIAALIDPRLWSRGLIRDLVRFAALGVLSFGLGIGLSALFHEALALPQEAAVGLSLGILLVTNFWLARVFIFRSAGKRLDEILRFAVVSACMRGLEYGLFFVLLRLLHANYLIALAVAMGLSNGIKFFLYRTVVFRGSRN